MILFDPARHEYSDSVTGEILPGVTSILKAAGHIDDHWYNQEACDKGSAVHELAERYANGERQDKRGRLLASLEYVNAFAEWQADTMAYALVTESIVHGSYNGKRWAGKFDGLFEIKGKRWLIDFKTGAPAKWHALQLGGYAIAQFEDGSRVNPNHCMALYLHADGTYKEDRLSGARLLDGINGFKECL